MRGSKTSWSVNTSRHTRSQREASRQPKSNARDGQRHAGRGKMEEWKVGPWTKPRHDDDDAAAASYDDNDDNDEDNHAYG